MRYTMRFICIFLMVDPSRYDRKLFCIFRMRVGFWLGCRCYGCGRIGCGIIRRCSCMCCPCFLKGWMGFSFFGLIKIIWVIYYGFSYHIIWS
jgi:hypothetical protein